MNRELLKKLVLEVLEKDSEAETHIPDEPEEESEFEEQEFGLDTKEHGLKEYGGKLKIVNEHLVTRSETKTIQIHTSAPRRTYVAAGY